MRVAIFGIAHWHYGLVLDSIRESPGDKLVGVSDPDAVRARAEGDRLGCAWSADFRELTRATHPDFVFVLGRHSDMASAGRFLLDEGIPFAMQKPCGMNYQEASALAEMAERKHAFAGTQGLAYRFTEVYDTLQRIAADDTFHHISFKWLVEPHSRILPMAPWALDPAHTGGGCVIISTPHMIDMFMLLTKGQRVSVQSAVLSNRAEGNQVEDFAHYTLMSDGGAVGSIEIDAGYVGMSDRGSVQQQHGRARFVYQEFTARFDGHYFSCPDIETLEVTNLRRWREVGSGADAPIETLHVAGHIAHGMANACKDMLARARAGQQPRTTIRDMAEVVRVVDDIYAAGRSTLNIPGRT